MIDSFGMSLNLSYSEHHALPLAGDGQVEEMLWVGPRSRLATVRNIAGGGL